jgi:hypothetical protein
MTFQIGGGRTQEIRSITERADADIASNAQPRAYLARGMVVIQMAATKDQFVEADSACINSGDQIACFGEGNPMYYCQLSTSLAFLADRLLAVLLGAFVELCRWQVLLTSRAPSWRVRKQGQRLAIPAFGSYTFGISHSECVSHSLWLEVASGLEPGAASLITQQEA